MANIKSAQKRISTIERRNAENKFVKATLSTKVKKLRKMIEEGNVVEAEKFSKEVYAYIDSACSKGVIHKNAASRKVGRLAAALFKAKANAQPAKEEKVEKVAKVEAAPVEETPVKKTTTRKTTTTKKAETEEKKPAKKTTTKKAETAEEKPAKKTTTRKTTKKAE